MDKIADELRSNPRHIAADDQIAFRQVQKVRLPNLGKDGWLDLFAVWRERYEARQMAAAVAVPARLAKLWAERDALFTKRASLPPSERAAVTARIEEIAREIADLAAPGRAAVFSARSPWGRVLGWRGRWKGRALPHRAPLLLRQVDALLDAAS